MGKNNSVERLQDALTDIRDEYIIEAAAVPELETAGDSNATASDNAFGHEGMDIYPATDKDGHSVSKTIRKWRFGRFLPAAAACAALAAFSAITVKSLSVKIDNAATASATASAPESIKSAPASYVEGGGDASVVTDGINAVDGGPVYMAADEDAASISDKSAASISDRAVASVSSSPSSGMAYDGDGEEYPEVLDGPIFTEDHIEVVQASSLVLTAGAWNDNTNWPFFTNLVNSGTISFPAYGLDPCRRIEVAVTDEDGAALRGETVRLFDEEKNVLWTARTDKEGRAYLFSKAGEMPYEVVVNDTAIPVETEVYQEADGADPGEGDEDAAPGQVRRSATVVNHNEIHAVTEHTADVSGLQVMFVIDTTGSMSDEIAYLQKDFSSIAEEVGGDVSWSVNFYRDNGDEYVTKCFDFTTDVAEVQSLINTEYAEGGGDTPEAVSQILDETITENGGWDEEASKLLFLVFDAPPHDDQEVYKVLEAVKSASARGIRIVPVVASNADRSTEVFGRALSIMTGSDYVFLTDDSGVGESHLEPIIGDYEVELLHDIIVRMINEARP
jgi:hypothetical protein